jgi:Secretion system C-terminal sorting domain
VKTAMLIPKKTKHTMMKKVCSLSIAICMSAVLWAQSLTLVTPNSAIQGTTGLAIQISGNNLQFSQGSGTYNAYFNQGSSTYIIASNVNVLDTNTLTATLDIPFSSALGAYTLTVYGHGTARTLPAAFTVMAGPVPQLVSVDTNYADIGTTLDVTISGVNTHFQSGTGTYVYFNQGSNTIVPNSIQVINSTTIKANISISFNNLLGFYTANVYNPIDNYLQLVNGLYISDTIMHPIVIGGSGSGTQGGTYSITITGTGTHFGTVGTTTTVWLAQHHRSVVSNIFPTVMQIVNPTQINATFGTLSNTPAGYYDVYVLNTKDGQLTKARAFMLNPTGVNEVETHAVHIYPNPLTDVFTLSVSTDILGSVYTLTDLSGQVVLKGTVPHETTTVSTAHLSSGMYILQLGGRSYKIIKE